MHKIKNKRKRSRQSRLGGVAVEFAMIAPVFFLVLFGGIEFASIHVTQCAIENAAFEGVRRGIVPGASAADCKQAAERILDATRINVYQIDVQPTVIDDFTNEVSVTVTVPMTPENKFGLSAFLNGGDLVKTITLPREGEVLEEVEVETEPAENVLIPG